MSLRFTYSATKFAAAAAIAAGLAKNAGISACDEPTEGCQLVVNSRMVALIAYLQRLGSVPKAEPLAAAISKGATP